MFDRRAERTPCGLTLADVELLMAARVTVWADQRHAERLARDAAIDTAVATRVATWRATREKKNAWNRAYRATRKAEAEAAP